MSQTQKNNKSKSVPTLEKPSSLINENAEAFRDAIAEVAQDDIIGTNIQERKKEKDSTNQLLDNLIQRMQQILTTTLAAKAEINTQPA
ncbi:4278_t:CDS:2 [Cetraspora pellucida]|uniref:4278_t:CDS:1 n=1 Tax=Cetraspora pellucida TaxID=1433469 RepID=A0A9N9HVJ0_9GLOM|nr:4278_t:CDS:2 [Cetraspora pellucida]